MLETVLFLIAKLEIGKPDGWSCKWCQEKGTRFFNPSLPSRDNENLTDPVLTQIYSAQYKAVETLICPLNFTCESCWLICEEDAA